MKQLLKAIEKKECGGSTYVATMISIFIIVLLFLALFLNYAQVQTQNRIERTYRKYLLKMETEGYLTSAESGALIAELTALGVKNIDLSGSSLSPVGYGQEVVLHIVGDVDIDKLNFNVSGDPARVKEALHIDIRKTGTALY